MCLSFERSAGSALSLASGPACLELSIGTGSIDQGITILLSWACRDLPRQALAQDKAVALLQAGELLEVPGGCAAPMYRISQQVM